MKICSYHSNLYFDSFCQHVAEMKAKGFDVILFCITETDMRFNMEIFTEFKTYAEGEGLECWATFWGLFAGEAVCTANEIGEKKIYLSRWLEKVINIGFNHIFIDEPKQASLNEIIHILPGFNNNQQAEGGKEVNFHLCLSDETFNELPDDKIKRLPFKSVGVSCYHWVKDWIKICDRTEAITKRLHLLRPADNFIFLQGFDIPAGWEDIPMMVKEIAEVYGIVNFGFWSFRSTAATGSKRPVNHEKVWEKVRFGRPYSISLQGQMDVL